MLTNINYNLLDYHSNNKEILMLIYQEIKANPNFNKINNNKNIFEILYLIY